MENYIRYYDDVVDETFCDNLVDLFESNTDHQQIMENEGHFRFAELKILDYPDTYGDIAKTLTRTFFDCIDQYKSDCNVVPEMFPRQLGYENFRMKKYLPNDVDQFSRHVDVGDYSSARRFLVFFLYLNEPKEGGETKFEQFGITVKPKKGRLLMFPPLWTHLHSGEKPIGSPKYIVGSYLHYV